MNERIGKLIEQAEEWVCKNHSDAMDDNDEFHAQTMEKFAELIVRECCEVAHCNFHVDGLTLGGIMKKHFGVEEYSAQPDQEAAAFIAAEDKKVASRYGYFPKLHPSEWKDK